MRICPLERTKIEANRDRTERTNRMKMPVYALKWEKRRETLNPLVRYMDVTREWMEKKPRKMTQVLGKTKTKQGKNRVPRRFPCFKNGDHDMCVPFTGSEAWTRSLGYKIVDEWRPWISDGQVAGYYYVTCFGTGNDFMSQDYMAHGSQGLFTQVGFSDSSQDDASHSHFGMANANPLQSHVHLSLYY
ncbi:hypothetical protein U1Q18_010023 [Sarracenia purpurea var. burkii]